MLYRRKFIRLRQSHYENARDCKFETALMNASATLVNKRVDILSLYVSVRPCVHRENCICERREKKSSKSYENGKLTGDIGRESPNDLENGSNQRNLAK